MRGHRRGSHGPELDRNFGEGVEGQRRRQGPHPLGSRESVVRFSGPRGPTRRSKRGDVRAAVLLLLDELPRNGYQLIQELERRSNGAWRASPGSIYPVLSQLEDEGLVVVELATSGRTFSLTPAGRTWLAERREAFGRPWEVAAKETEGPRWVLYGQLRQLIAAVRQVLEAGSDDQSSRALEVIKDARRRVYFILAEDEADV